MPCRPFLAVVTIVGVTFGFSACSGSGGGGSTVSSSVMPAAQSPVGSPPIAWSSTRNPIVRVPNHAVKDPAVVSAGGVWHALFSSVDGNGTWRIGTATSRDFARWSHFGAVPHDPSVEGEASPDVVRAPNGMFVVTYQSFVHDHGPGLAKLYYRTTTDFHHYSAPRPLARDLHPAPGDRVIDAALVWSPAGLLLGYKYGSTGGAQAFELARSASGGLDGPWVQVGRPDIRVIGDTVENYQFLHLNHGWQLLATTNNLDRPYLFELRGDARVPRGWLHWSAGRQLDVPRESWNAGTGLTGANYQHANCADLVDGRALSSRYYLVYSDATEMTTYHGEGQAVLAVARSPDLVHWSVPPG